MNTLLRIRSNKLRLWGLLSSMIVLLAAPLQAHEINPTIADLSVTEGQTTLVLRLNAEAYLSEFDLDEVTDTDDVAQDSAYEDLRAMSPDTLEAQIFAQEALFTKGIGLLLDGRLVALTLEKAGVPAVGDTDLPRLSSLTFTAGISRFGRAIAVVWPKGFGALVLRQQGVDAPFTGYLSGGETSPAIAIAGGNEKTGWQSLFGYIPVGFDHILPKGLDHILFVLGLFFLTMQMRPLLWQISAFTLAHTVTLALGSLGWVTVPASIVEPLIAASIVYVAVENILTDGLSRWRPFVIFGFGLLHGLGFASVLGEFGLPATQFLPALIGFNVGVELGQICVIALAFFGVGYWFGQKPWYRTRISQPASIVIAAVGAFWFVERVIS